MSTRSWPDRHQYWAAQDRLLAHALNQRASYRILLRACLLASRLGDGMLWYVMILALPVVAGRNGWVCAWHMVLAGLCSLAIYKLVKHRFSRPRPFLSCPEIRAFAQALDQFSFPSGHTFHAVGFSLVLTYYFPLVAVLCIPVTLLIALSRVVLGLHYPSDVLAGALLGAAVGAICIWAI